VYFAPGNLLTHTRLSPNQIQKLLNQYLVADYEQPINGEIMKAVASRVTEKSDVLLLTAVDMDDSGPYEIAEPRVITALETYTPSCKLHPCSGSRIMANISQGSKHLV
jgi:myosin-5